MSKLTFEQHMVNFYRTLFSLLGVFIVVGILLFVVSNINQAGFAASGSIQPEFKIGTNLSSRPFDSEGLSIPFRVTLLASAQIEVKEIILSIDGKLVTADFRRISTGNTFYSSELVSQIFSPYRDGIPHLLHIEVSTEKGSLSKEYQFVNTNGRIQIR